MSLNSNGRATLLGLAFLALTALAYLPGLSGGFLFDDYPQIVHQGAVQMEALDADSASAALGGFRHGIGRPLPMLSFALDHLAWGRQAFGYKLSSLLVHLANALLVYLLMIRVLACPDTPPPPTRLPVAAMLAAAWALHPLQASTVLYVVQRMETMSLFFVLMALLAYVSARRRQMQGRRSWHLLAACPPLVALGLACKETAALFPAYALALELTVLGFRADSPRTARNWRLVYGFAVIAGLVIIALLAPVYTAPEVFAIRDFTAAERVLTQFRVLPMYLGWTLLPDSGAYLFYYDQYPPSRGLLTPPTTLAGVLLLLGLAGSAWWCRKTMPLYSLGVLWFLSAHAITSSYLPLELVFEHRNYFALLGVLLAVYAIAAKAWGKPASPRLPLGVALLVLIGLAGLTILRTSTWGDPLHLAMDLAQRNPNSPRAGTGLADQYLLMARGTEDPFLQLARDEYERAAALPGASPIPEQGLVIMAARLGRPAKDAWWRSLVAKLASQPIGPQEMAVVTSLLDLRNEGLPIDDRRLSEAYVVLSERMTLPATQYFAFAMHALVDLDDPRLAREMLALAADNAREDEALLNELASYLQAHGFADEANYLQTHSRPQDDKALSR